MMRLFDLFRRGTKTSSNPSTRVARGATFVMTLDGNLYSDPSGRVTDVDLAGGAREVAGAGRMVATEGRILEITNESPTYHPSLAQMHRFVERLAGMGADLKGDGGGVVVMVYAMIDENGYGKRGTRYRVANSAAGVELIPEEVPDSNGSRIIFRAADGRTLTMNDLQHETGTFQYEIPGDVDVSAEAQSLHQQGRRAGEQGDHKKAIALFERASALSPQWPYPVYDRAYAHLLMKDYSRAREYYEKTLKLAPRGFFTAITAVDTLEREQKGDLPTGTYLSYLSLEWIKDQAKRTEAVHELVERLPQYAPAWKALATLADNDTERLEAIENGLAANPDAETKGALQINKALVINTQGDRNGALALLGTLALDPNSPRDKELMAKATLANIFRK